MSDYNVIGNVGETLKKLLDDDNYWTDLITPKPKITFKSPKELKDDPEGTNTVSIYLYQILENQHLRNEAMQRVDSSHFQPAPLALDLFYLITPYHNDKIMEKVILGKVLQIFYDNPILTGTDLHDIEANEEIKILFNPISLDDLTKIWSAFQEAAYRLSVSYLVSPVRIDSLESTKVSRVESKKSGYYIK